MSEIDGFNIYITILIRHLVNSPHPLRLLPGCYLVHSCFATQLCPGQAWGLRDQTFLARMSSLWSDGTPSLPCSDQSDGSEPGPVMSRNKRNDSRTLFCNIYDLKDVFLCWCVSDCVFTCRSFCGFQSESKMMHVSAAVRLMPRPPALVHRRKTNRSESGLLKRSMAAWRRFPRTRPSIRSYKYLYMEGGKIYKQKFKSEMLF